MQIFRWLVMLSALGIIASFALYIATGQERYKMMGLQALKWTMLAGLGFFTVLILQRMA